MTRDELADTLRTWATHDYLSRCCGSIPGEKERHEAIRQEAFDLILDALSSPGVPNERTVPVELLERCKCELTIFNASIDASAINELLADLRAAMETGERTSDDHSHGTASPAASNANPKENNKTRLD